MASRKHLLIVTLSLLCLMGLAACAGTPYSANTNTSTTTTTNQTKLTNTSTPTPAATPGNKKTTTKLSPAQNTQPNQQQGNTNQNTSASTTTGNNTTSATNTGNAATANSSSSTQSNTQNAPQSSTPQNGNTSSSTTTNNTTNQAPTGPIYIKIVQESVNGQMMQVLTTGTGMTLYYRSSDVTPNAVCTGTCAQVWPPLLAQGQIITSNTITSGQLTIQTTSNGKQVEYNGHPLYTYTGDKASGQVTGQGVGNIWSTISVTIQRAHW
jgi:predicted lipoprotein with Yx(FWY)xxD motif